MFAAGIALGAGVGLVLGLALGQVLMRTGLDTIQQTIEKVTYSLRFPSAPSNPVQISSKSEEVFKDLESDDERVPDWMDEEFSLS